MLDLMEIYCGGPRMAFICGNRSTAHLWTQAPCNMANKLIIPSVWEGEAMVSLADPANISTNSSAPLIEVADCSISIEVWPPASKIPMQKNDGVKVIYVSVTDSQGIRSPLGRQLPQA